MNAKGRVKGDGAFKFYVSKSLLEEVWAITHDARRTTHDAQSTTHDAQNTKHDAQRTTQDARPTTHYPPTPISQSRLLSITSNAL